MRRRAPRGGLVAAVVVLAVVAALALGGARALRDALYPLRYGTLIDAASREAGVDPYLVAAIIRVESGFDPEAVSSAGAVGLMQVKPSTARSIARIDSIPGKMNSSTLKDPERNITVGTAYLAYLLDRYGGDVPTALAAYNGGLTNADAWAAAARRSGRSLTDAIEFPETAAYVERVRVQRELYRWLYPGAFSR